ncbi:MAG: ATP synthase F1 subunit epsilon [Myxococcales bacterium]|nr:ATP synthase F1 subunit epsilon [Myxococcales bacterium]
MSLHLEVVTPRGMVVKTEVESVRLPGKVGEFAVLEGHIPLLSALKPGILRYEQGSEHVRMAIGSGFVEVGAGDRVLVLTDEHADRDDIDRGEVEAELSKASKALEGWTSEIELLEDGEWKEVADHRALRERIDWAQAQLDLLASND